MYRDPVFQKIIDRALKEDQSHHDITTNILVPENQISKACIIVRQEAVICGLDVAKYIFKKFDPKMKFTFFCKDGDRLKRNCKVVCLKGKTRAILTGERLVLNFMAYLSGISTETNKFVKKAHPYQVKIMDTRKTIPGLRALVKMAVRTGGGVNHRFNLKEMVMIKDNHLIAYKREKTIENAIKHVRKKTRKIIVIEVDSLIQFKQALDAQPDIILLDNMSPRQLKKSVKINNESKNKCLLEASGGITLRTIRAVAKTGVDRISIGALTHSPNAIDFSMEFKG